MKTRRKLDSRLLWVAVAILAVFLIAGGYWAFSIWSYFNPEGWSGEYTLRVKLIPPPGKKITRAYYYVNPTMYFGDDEDRREFHRDGRIGYEVRMAPLTPDSEITIDVKCGGLRWLHGDSGYNQKPQTILLMVEMNDGHFEHLMGLPGYYSKKRSILLDLENPPDDLIAQREKRRQR